MANDPFDRFVAAFGAERVRRDVPLAPLTTFGVGGPADCLIEVLNSRELAAAFDLAAETGVTATVLGGGSNVLVSDAGVRGVVIHAHGGETVREGESGVRADAGVHLNGLIRWTIARGLAGLEAFAGTPGSVGGAVSGNAHYGGQAIAEHVREVRLLAADRRILDALGAAGARVVRAADGATVERSDLRAFTFDATDSPDLLPPLAALACHCAGTSQLKGASRLRHKESDRAAALSEELRRLGGRVTVLGDILEITGGLLQGGTVRSHGDHRIAMALAAAAVAARGPVGIEDAECVAKSYPGFFEDLASVGVRIDE